MDKRFVVCITELVEDLMALENVVKCFDQSLQIDCQRDQRSACRNQQD